jgi:hypothetical protein
VGPERLGRVEGAVGDLNGPRRREPPREDLKDAIDAAAYATTSSLGDHAANPSYAVSVANGVNRSAETSITSPPASGISNTISAANAAITATARSAARHGLANIQGVVASRSVTSVNRSRSIRSSRCTSAVDA